MDWTVRHIPAALRIFGAMSDVGAPRLTEDASFGAIRTMMAPDFKLNPTKRQVLTFPDPAVQMISAWLKCNPAVLRWWRSSSAWRAPREFSGWRAIEDEAGFPHLEPHEVAQMRLPEDIAMDADVVLFQAWCQGFTSIFMDKMLPGNPTWGFWQTCIREGLRKMLSSPYIRLVVAVPFIPPIGVAIAPHGLVESSIRMRTLLKHPYLASLDELDEVLRSSAFAEAFDKAHRVRKRGQFSNPAGGWYACGALNPLGVSFRRGATWTAKKRGAA